MYMGAYTKRESRKSTALFSFIKRAILLLAVLVFFLDKRSITNDF